MSDYDKEVKRSIADVKRGIKNLRKLNLKIEVHETETMMGADINHVYVVDRMHSGRVCFQKHLFTF